MRTGTFPLHNRLLDGKLVKMLADWRAEGLSHEQIARELHAKGVEVSTETVRRWCHAHLHTDKAAS